MYRYPPGHGDVFPALTNSGKLDAMLSKVYWFGLANIFFPK